MTFFLKKEKTGIETWWIGSCPQNFAWTHAALSEKPEFTHGQTDDGRLRHDCSSAGNVKQS